MATAATLRTMSDDQLLDEHDSATQELFSLRFQFATSQSDNFAQLPKLRKDIARIKTVLREREIAAAEALVEDAVEPLVEDATKPSSEPSTEEQDDQ